LRWYQDDSSDRGSLGHSRNRVRLRAWLKRVKVPWSGLPAWQGLLVAAALTAIIGFHVFTFRVNPDELGVVLRFGKPARQEPPGLHYRMPYPIDEVHLPKITRWNIIEVGIRTPSERGRPIRVREESSMLTGDENIIDVSFVILWRIEDAGKYLFNIQNPEITVKDLAESALRETIGRSESRPLLTSARLQTEKAAQKLMQETLDHYEAGIRIEQVLLQSIDPPPQTIDAFRDVQAAATDKERSQNEAEAYSSRVVPEARGEGERILQGALAYRGQSVAEALGQTARFLSIYEEYRKAPEVTRKRMYLETMERIMQGTDKIVIDNRFGRGVVPMLSVGSPEKKHP
jgi:modulator of FtsH protease HflK